MKTIIIVLSSLITLLASVPYMLQIARGADRPRVVTWSIWSILAAIGAAAAFTQHQIPAGILTLTTCVEYATIVGLGFKHGDHTVSRFDALCLLGVFIGLGVWFFVKSPTLAIAIIILVDLVATIPTFVHSWTRPYEESWLTFLTFVIAEIMILAISNFHIFNGYAYPLFYFLEDSLLAALIFFSPHRQSPVEEITDLLIPANSLRGNLTTAHPITAYFPHTASAPNELSSTPPVAIAPPNHPPN